MVLNVQPGYCLDQTFKSKRLNCSMWFLDYWLFE